MKHLLLRFVSYLTTKLLGYDILESEKGLKASLKDAHRKVDALSEQIIENLNTVKNKDLQIKNQANLIEELKDEISSKDSDIDNLSKDNAKKDQAIEQLVDQNKSKSAHILELSGSIDTKDKELFELGGEIANLKEQNKSKQGTIMNHVKRINALELEVERTNAEKESIAGQKKECEEIIKDKNQKIGVLTQQKEDKDKQIEEVYNELNIIKKEKDDILNNKNSEIEKLILCIDGYKKRIDEAGVELNSVTKDRDSLLKNIEEKENTIRNLQSAYDNLVTNINEEEIEEKNEEIKLLAEKLNEADVTIQNLNERVAFLQSENNRLEDLLKTQKEEEKKTQVIVNRLLLEKDEEIRSLKAKINEFENLNSEERAANSCLPSNSGNNDSVSGTTSHLEDKDTIVADLPTLTNNSSVVTQRRIKSVYNYWTSETIDSDEFFRQPQETIMIISRRLETIAKNGGEPYLLCSNCFKPVKISKISTLKGESKFFIHCSHDEECEWRSKNETEYASFTPFNDVDFKDEIYNESRYSEIKELIFEILKNYIPDEVNEISTVKKDSPVRGKVDGGKWRRADISLNWNGQKVMIKLQRSTDGTRELNSYDEFCKRNGIFIIWIFGSETGTSYHYLLEHNYQFTLFDNKSCVFIFDIEAENESKKSNKLYLKCNWLDDGKHWHFTNEKTQCNGILVSLEDLVFEEGTNYKPYFKGLQSNSSKTNNYYIEIKKGIYKYKDKFLWGLYNKSEDIKTECKYKDIYVDDQGKIYAETADYIKPRKGILSERGEEIETLTYQLTDILKLVCVFERWFLVSDGVAISNMYDSLTPWSFNRLIAKDDNGFSVIDYTDEKVSSINYKSIEIINKDKARVHDFEGTYEIDSNCNIIPDKTITLQDGMLKVCHLGKWGIMDNTGKLVVNYVYHEIVSFRRRFYGFTNDSLIKLPNAPEYKFRIPFTATYKRTVASDYVFNFNGIDLYMPDNIYNHDNRIVNKDYTVYLLNIERNEDNTIKLTIAAAPENIYKLMFNHIDKDSDFEKGKRYEGKVIKVKPKRLYIEFPDGKETYISKNRIKQQGFNPSDYNVGSYITIEKIDFEWFYETTGWKVIK